MAILRCRKGSPKFSIYLSKVSVRESRLIGDSLRRIVRFVDSELHIRSGLTDLQRTQAGIVAVTATIAIGMLWSLLAAEPATELPSDVNATNVVFGDHFLSENVAAVRKRVTATTLEERFHLLSDWVLPSSTHRMIRLQAEFTQTNPVPVDPDPDVVREMQVAVKSGLTRVSVGGRFISPAWMLVQAARELNELSSLRARIESIHATTESQQRCRLALLAMVQIADGDLAGALQLLDDLERRIRARSFPDLNDRWPETVLLSVAVDYPELRDTSEALLNHIVTAQIRKNHNSGPQQWDRMMSALLGRLRFTSHTQAGPTRRANHLAALSNWIPVSEYDEATRALGFPPGRWQVADDRVENVANHQNEYLLYRIPLRGNYEIECDTTCFGYRECQLVVGGKWVSPHFAHELYYTGDFRGEQDESKADPKLSLVNDWVHYRAVVRDSQLAMHFNGRKLLDESIRDTQFPWPGLRSPWFSNGNVRDVRITGTPEIPDSVQMSADPKLSGWVRFHLDNISQTATDSGATASNSGSDWWFDPSLGRDGGIMARRKTEFADTFQESLLRYVRPMVEDGVIEYEFLHKPGRAHVSPALDRQAFLIDPDGVTIHWITSGVWDQSGIDPLNHTLVKPQIACPLIEGWNQVRLELAGDRVKISVNERTVYDGDVHPTNDRTFGLFHYADQSEVRVRNMTWTGQWPKSLPTLSDQELRSRKLDSVEQRVAKLNARIEFDFTRTRPDGNDNSMRPFSPNVFRSHLATGSLVQQTDGLLMSQKETVQYQDVWTTPAVRLAGDFDIIAEFSDLELGTPQDGHARISLTTVTQDEFNTHNRIWYGVYEHPDIERRSCAQIEFLKFRGDRGTTIDVDGLTPEACRTGRLRMTRIGRRRYYMVAEGCSPSFRLVHTAEMSDAPLSIDGIRLGAGTYDNGGDKPRGSAKVVWKALRIRAEEFLKD